MATFIPSGKSTHESSIRAGEYPCEIVGAVEKTSSDGRFVQHRLRVRVSDDLSGDWEDFWELLTFSPRAQWKVEEVLEALGIGFTIGIPVELEASDWMGKTGRLVLKEDFDGGQKRLRIARWLVRQGAPVANARTRHPGHAPSAEGDSLSEPLPF
jgi:hypothetical protein